MIIGIKGTSFKNKGAELMLYAVIEKVRERIPGAKIVHDRVGNKYKKKLANLNLCLSTKDVQQERKNGVKWMPRLSILGGKKIEKVHAAKIQVLLDASGFSYSDQMSNNTTIGMARRCVECKKNGTKIVLLPQAFGPFSPVDVRNSLVKIVDLADLIYARDKQSYGYIVELTGERNNLKLAPDFTILLKGTVPKSAVGLKQKICIMPNDRMIERTSADESTQYLAFMKNCIECLTSKGEDLFMLVHGGKKDARLAHQIRSLAKVRKRIQIIKEASPLHIKGIIGQSKGVIGSRFHGLVNALSQGVPSLCVGWSHKYKMLFDDYGFPEGMLSSDLSPEKVATAMSMITDARSLSEIRRRLLVAGDVQKKRVEEMWDEIFDAVL